MRSLDITTVDMAGEAGILMDGTDRGEDGHMDGMVRTMDIIAIMTTKIMEIMMINQTFQMHNLNSTPNKNLGSTSY